MERLIPPLTFSLTPGFPWFYFALGGNDPHHGLGVSTNWSFVFLFWNSTATSRRWAKCGTRKKRNQPTWNPERKSFYSFNIRNLKFVPCFICFAGNGEASFANKDIGNQLISDLPSNRHEEGHCLRFWLKQHQGQGVPRRVSTIPD